MPRRGKKKKKKDGKGALVMKKKGPYCTRGTDGPALS